MVWLILFISGLFEVLLIICLKKSQGFRVKKFAIAAILAQITSIYLLSVVVQTLALNIAYVFWVAVGSLGSIVYGILFNNESKSKKKLCWVAALIFGVLLLKSAG